jgi:hypothetical protein
VTTDEHIAEVLTGLRALRQNPTPEAASDLLTDWTTQGEYLDRTDSAWRQTQCSGTL